jgi:Flp pilus assembly pilin Flp
MQFLKKFLIEEEGQDLVEYGLVLALVVVGAATAYSAFGTAITASITTATGKISALFP